MTDKDVAISDDDPLWKKRVYQLVIEHGGKLRPISKAAGLSETYLRDLFTRNVSPTIGRLEMLAAFHGVDITWFFTEENQPADIAELQRAYRTLSPAMREFLLRSALLLAEQSEQQ